MTMTTTTEARRSCLTCAAYIARAQTLGARHEHTQHLSHASHLMRNGQHPRTLDQAGRRTA